MLSDENKIEVESMELNNYDFFFLTNTIWNKRKIVIKIIAAFLILGLIVALLSKKEYTASTTLLPQLNNSSQSLKGISSLASLAGFNFDMSNGNNEISPIIYPKIVSSTSFKSDIMTMSFKFREVSEEMTLYDYYLEFYKPGLFQRIKEYTIGLPGKIIKNIKEKKKPASRYSGSELGLISISQEQKEVLEIINANLKLSVNEDEGYLTLEARFPEAELSAQVAKKAQKLLQDYIIEIKTERAKEQLRFIQDQTDKAKTGFDLAQSKLASYRDKNKNVTSAVAKTEESKLENEFQLSFEIYSELSKQLENAKIKVNENTPVFIIIEDVVIPTEKSKPDRILILIAFLTIGAIIGISYVFGELFIGKYQSRINLINS